MLHPQAIQRLTNWPGKKGKMLWTNKTEQMDGHAVNLNKHYKELAEHGPNNQ